MSRCRRGTGESEPLRKFASEFGDRFDWHRYRLTETKNRVAIGLHSKGQFSKIRHISKEACRIFAFEDTNVVLVKKIDGLQARVKTEVNPRIRLAVLPFRKSTQSGFDKTKKTRTYTHGSRETPKSERRTFAKKCPAPMYKYESKSSFR